MPTIDTTLPPLKHTSRQYWLCARLSELALKRDDWGYVEEAADSFFELEPSWATRQIAQLWTRLIVSPDREHEFLPKIIAALWELHERARQEEGHE